MVTASIVLYKENIHVLKKTIDSFLSTPIEKKLFLIDNSPTNILEKHFKHINIEYLFVGENIGFGRAHNLILKELTSSFHLILNRDVEFSSNLIPDLIIQLKNCDDVSFISPKVTYPNSSFQYICRKHPTFLDLLNRKLKFSKKLIQKNEYRSRDLNKTFYPEFIQGCFMLFKTADFKNLNGFDERFFLYMEDADICRRIEESGKKILYFPDIKIIHYHQRGSSKKIKLFFYHFSSAIKYFSKWRF